MMEDDYDYLFKIVLTGDSSVGKSQLLNRLCNNKFSEESKSTIGVEFLLKNVKIKNHVCKAQIWDTAGQERYRAITKAYYRGCVGVIIVYDIVNHISYENVTRWLKEINDNIDPNNNIVVALIGNKVDLTYLRTTLTHEAETFAIQNNMLFFETSAKTGENVELVFDKIVNAIYNNIIQREVTSVQNNTIIIKQEETRIKKCCN